MDTAGPIVMIALGLVMLGIGWRARIRIVALGGVANVLGASLLLPSHGFGLLHYLALAVLAILVLTSISREIWWSIRVELSLTGAIIAAVWTSELLATTIPRELQMGLLGLIAILTVVWIGLILFRITKEHLGQPLQR